MRIITVSDVHGRHESLYKAIERFKKEHFDKIVFLGDFADSYDRTNEDILRCYKMAMDLYYEFPDKVEWLFGNHDWQYYYGRHLCSGFRGDLCISLNPLINENRKIFKIAYGYENYLFTHAGIQQSWYNRHKDLINSCGGETIAENLNNMLQMRIAQDVLYEIGPQRGGDSRDYGGPMWADMHEIMDMYCSGPIEGYHQIVGHTPQNDIYEFTVNSNTSVTFCDVLGKHPDKFYTLDI